MVKKLADGSMAIGLFNRGKTKADVGVEWGELKISGKHQIRDLWREKDLGVYGDKFITVVPPQGVVMIKISK